MANNITLFYYQYSEVRTYFEYKNSKINLPFLLINIRVKYDKTKLDILNKNIKKILIYNNFRHWNFMKNKFLEVQLNSKDKIENVNIIFNRNHHIKKLLKII